MNRKQIPLGKGGGAVLLKNGSSLDLQGAVFKAESSIDWLPKAGGNFFIVDSSRFRLPKAQGKFLKLNQA